MNIGENILRLFIGLIIMLCYLLRLISKSVLYIVDELLKFAILLFDALEQ